MRRLCSPEGSRNARSLAGIRQHFGVDDAQRQIQIISRFTQNPAGSLRIPPLLGGTGQPVAHEHGPLRPATAHIAFKGSHGK